MERVPQRRHQVRQGVRKAGRKAFGAMSHGQQNSLLSVSTSYYGLFLFQPSRCSTISVTVLSTKSLLWGTQPPTLFQLYSIRLKKNIQSLGLEIKFYKNLMSHSARAAVMFEFPSTKTSKNQLGRGKSTWLELRQVLPSARCIHVSSINTELINMWN